MRETSIATVYNDECIVCIGLHSAFASRRRFCDAGLNSYMIQALLWASKLDVIRYFISKVSFFVQQRNNSKGPCRTSRERDDNISTGSCMSERVDNDNRPLLNHSCCDVSNGHLYLQLVPYDTIPFGTSTISYALKRVKN
jgi:hypothetical protein